MSEREVGARSIVHIYMLMTNTLPFARVEHVGIV